MMLQVFSILANIPELLSMSLFDNTGRDLAWLERSRWNFVKKKYAQIYWKLFILTLIIWCNYMDASWIQNWNWCSTPASILRMRTFQNVHSQQEEISHFQAKWNFYSSLQRMDGWMGFRCFVLQIVGEWCRWIWGICCFHVWFFITQFSCSFLTVNK